MPEPTVLAEPEFHPPPISKADYGIGVIGTGWVMDNYELPAYRAAGFNIAALCDIQPEVVERVGSKWEVGKRYTDHRQLLEDPEVQIVELAIPAFDRLAIFRDICAAGKHVLAQKPLTRSYQEALAMVAAADEAGVKFGVNSHYRWLASFRATQSLLAAQPIGEVFSILSDMHGNQDHVYYYEIPERRWNAELDDFLTVEWGAHHFDYLRFWTGLEPISVFYQGTRMPGQNFKSDMNATILVEFPPPLRATLIFDEVYQADDTGWTFLIQGTDGVIKGQAYQSLACYSRELGDRWQEWHLEPHAWRSPDDRPSAEQALISGTLQDIVDESYIGVMGDLMNAITEDREHISSGRDNVKTVRAYLAAATSAREGRKVYLEEIE